MILLSTYGHQALLYIGWILALCSILALLMLIIGNKLFLNNNTPRVKCPWCKKVSRPKPGGETWKYYCKHCKTNFN